MTAQQHSMQLRQEAHRVGGSLSGCRLAAKVVKVLRCSPRRVASQGHRMTRSTGSRAPDSGRKIVRALLTSFSWWLTSSACSRAAGQCVSWAPVCGRARTLAGAPVHAPLQQGGRLTF